jgi:hypothetical protein
VIAAWASRYGTPHSRQVKLVLFGLLPGLATHVGGYLLKSSATTEPLGLVADLFYRRGNGGAQRLELAGEPRLDRPPATAVLAETKSGSSASLNTVTRGGRR